jgi:hypothetical protein
MAIPSPTVGQRRLARTLRRFRADAGLTIDQVAEKRDPSTSTISRMETTRAGVRRPEVRELLDIYRGDGHTTQSAAAARGGKPDSSPGGSSTGTCLPPPLACEDTHRSFDQGITHLPTPSEQVNGHRS